MLMPKQGGLVKTKTIASGVVLFVIVLACMSIAAEPGMDKLSHKAGTVKTVDIGGGMKMDFVWCPPGSFMMGSSQTQQDSAIKALPGALSDDTKQSTIIAIQNEGPQHQVTLTKGFWMANTEVTQAQWMQVMGNNPSKFIDSGPDAPVETVSWNDCQAFIAKLNVYLAKQKGGNLRLPSEAEWEYACRAGTKTAYYFGDDAAKLGGSAWFAGNSGMKTQPVGRKKPNEWGLYDMHGNVWEWCADFYGKYPANDVTDPAWPATGQGRVGRGGGWDDFAGDCRVAYRSYGRSSDFKASPLGFRPVLLTEY